MKPSRRILDEKRELPCAGRRLDQHLIAMRQQVGVAVPAAVLAVVVDRMVVA